MIQLRVLVGIRGISQKDWGQQLGESFQHKLWRLGWGVLIAEPEGMEINLMPNALKCSCIHTVDVSQFI